jgi:hypothetical protein
MRFAKCLQRLHCYLKPGDRAQRPQKLPRRLQLESLEDRALLSVTASLSQGVLHVDGTAQADTIYLHETNSGLVYLDGVSGGFLASSINKILINGGAGNDTIRLDLTDNIPGFVPITIPAEIHGGDGDDLIVGGRGSNTIFGEAGNDTIWGGAGGNYIDGGIGNDTLVGGANCYNQLFGDAGADLLYGGSGSSTNVLYGGDDSDELVGAGSYSSMDGGRGYDYLFGGPGANGFYDDPGSNYVYLGPPGSSYSMYYTHIDWFDMNLSDPGFRSAARFAANDGSTNRNDAINLLEEVRADNYVSSAEMADLKAWVTNPWAVNMPDYVHNLANKVVNGDPANSNAVLRDGSAPGTLAAGEDGQILGNLKGMWFKGSRHPVASNYWDPNHSAASDFGYAYAQGTLFGGSNHDRVDPSIIKQGGIGDCYFLGALGEVALRNPQAIKNMFIDNGDGTFMVRFFEGGVAQYVTVDRYLPVDSWGHFVFDGTGALASDSSNVLWVALAEKAYMQLNASGWIGQDDSYSSNGMDASHGGISGGDCGLVMTQVYENPSTFTSMASTSFTGIWGAWVSGEMITFASKSDQSPNSSVVGNHCYILYTVIPVYTGNPYQPLTYLYVLQNPWGNQDPSKPQYIVLDYNGLMNAFDGWYGMSQQYLIY